MHKIKAFLAKHGPLSRRGGESRLLGSSAFWRKRIANYFWKSPEDVFPITKTPAQRRYQLASPTWTGELTNSGLEDVC